jgi:hypothetical protein
MSERAPKLGRLVMRRAGGGRDPAGGSAEPAKLSKSLSSGAPADVDRVLAVFERRADVGRWLGVCNMTKTSRDYPSDRYVGRTCQALGMATATCNAGPLARSCLAAPRLANRREQLRGSVLSVLPGVFPRPRSSVAPGASFHRRARESSPPRPVPGVLAVPPRNW